MFIALDVGNTHTLCGVFEGETMAHHCRYATHQLGTSDQFGLFLRQFLEIKGLSHAAVKAVGVCSVVPAVNYTLRHAAQSYFPSAEYFSLQAGVKTGLHIRYKNPAEVGADRIANAIAAVQAFPDKNLIIVDMGTATTFCVVNKNKDYLGGVILPGMRVSMEALKLNTAKLMEVDLVEHAEYLGQTTRESIQKGLYFGQLGALREIIGGLKREQFKDEAVTVIGTGGFSRMFENAGVFDTFLPDLVLQGVRLAYGMKG